MSQKKIPRDAKAILDRYIAGYHEYILSSPARLSYASGNLCDMLGCGEAELVSASADLYEPMVHPADSGRYREFLASLAEKEGTRTLEYRIVKKNGEIRRVADTMTSRRRDDGVMEGFSSLADITDIRAEEDIRAISDTVPCGVLRYTCEKTPRVTYANRNMVELMRVGGDAGEAIEVEELYRSNVYMAIAPESRTLFAGVLQKVYLQGAPVAGELTVTRGDGSTGRLFGWVTKSRGADGEEEFQSICIDITERYLRKKKEQAESYLRALTGIYGMIFEFDRARRTVRYMHGNASYLGEYLEGLPMALEQATDRWLNRFVAEEDRAKLRRFLVDNILKERDACSGEPPQIRVRILREEDNTYADHQAILLRTDATTAYFCCRELVSGPENRLLRRENDSLISRNEEMQELVRRFTDGVVAFEVTGDRVKPLYFSDNASAFFGYSKETWQALAADRPAIREFVARTGVDYGRFEELFRKGEAEFSYRDTASGKMQKVKAVCSSLENNPDEPKYVMLYQADGGQKEDAPEEQPAVQIRTFGYFDVFVNSRPIMFKTEKAKELLAILVDRRGGYVTPDEAIALLWEDEPASAVVLARYRKVALRLRNQLEEYGVPDIVESVSGKRRIVPERVECDLYQYLSGDAEHAGLFHGSYLTNYSWAETTLGELDDRSRAEE